MVAGREVPLTFRGAGGGGLFLGYGGLGDLGSGAGGRDCEGDGVFVFLFDATGCAGGGSIGGGGHWCWWSFSLERFFLGVLVIDEALLGCCERVGI